MQQLYKGFIETKGKAAVEKFKGKTTFKTYQEVKDLDGFGGVLADDTILIDIDDSEQSEIMMNIVEDLQLDCKVYQTSRGRHFLFKNTKIARNRTHVPLAIGLTADIKCGSRTSYEVIKIDGEERFCEWDIEPGGTYQQLPKWMFPVKANVDFLNMDAGDGRNDALFTYILTLTANDFGMEETREAIRILNKYVFKEPLADEELDVILRDEAFQKPVFFMGSTFLFDKFAVFMKNTRHIGLINGQLHVFKDGVYVYGYKEIESAMIELIPNLRDAQRKEVLKYLTLICEELEISDARYIAFNNGIYDIVDKELLPFDSRIILTNKIPWNYTPDAYNELADKTLNKLSCGDGATRSLLEECIGYCFYRRNELGKAFILTGDKSNGKSTFLDCIKAVLGEQNISALDLKELGDRFSTAMMFGKLANIGDDIGDDFLQGSQVSIFKKVVTGNRIKAERKGQDPFEFNPFIKLLFSANDIPRMKDKTGAVLRRLVIIPFNATFTKDDPDFDVNIKYKLIQQESIEYLIQLGIAGLERVRVNQGFITTKESEQAKQEYEEENNPIVAFIKEVGNSSIINQPTCDVFKRYEVFCSQNGLVSCSNIVFSKDINRKLKTEVKQKKINGKKFNIFMEVQE